MYPILMHPKFHIVPAHLSSFIWTWTWIPSRLAVNKMLWTAGLVLQCALAVVAFRRGIARRFPCFAALLCFYPLRACLSLALPGRVDADVYTPLFSALTFTATLLLAAVAVELMWRIVQEMYGDTRRSMQRGLPVLLFVLCAAGGLTWLVLKLASARGPIDRVQVFTWFAMIALFAVAVKNARSANPVRIAGGFAAFSLIQLATWFGRTHAYLKHDAGWYLGWSYAPAVGYLAVVTFWLCSLGKEPRRDRQS
jgi:hypothetical protein